VSQNRNNQIVEGFDDEKDDGLAIRLELCEDAPSCLLIHLGGRIDNYNSLYFQRSIDKIIFAGYRSLIFQCASLNYVSSTGIGAFTYILKNLKLKGGQMLLSHVQSRVYDVFELLGFTSFFAFTEDDDAAARELSQSAMPAPAQGNIFPLYFQCPRCSARLRTSKAGKFMCSSCKGRIVVDEGGTVKAWAG